MACQRNPITTRTKMGIHPAKNVCAEGKRFHHCAGSARRIDVMQTEADLLARRGTTTELAGLRQRDKGNLMRVPRFYSAVASAKGHLRENARPIPLKIGRASCRERV